MTTVAVVGLGYVGLPLAVEFGRHFRTVGVDISEKKLAQLRRGVDPAGALAAEDLKRAERVEWTSDP